MDGDLFLVRPQKLGNNSREGCDSAAINYAKTSELGNKLAKTDLQAMTAYGHAS